MYNITSLSGLTHDTIKNACQVKLCVITETDDDDDDDDDDDLYNSTENCPK